MIQRLLWFLLITMPLTPVAVALELEEVVVTAQKREQSLQDVSISVAVLNGADLAALNKTQIRELTRLVPSLTYATGTSDAGQSIVVRGVGTQTFSRAVDQSVGTVVDGVAAGSVSGSLLDFSDVDRIEVLRGPQGMLFGKNASAGVLNISTRNPTPELTAGFGALYGEENRLELNGYLSGAIIEDKLLARVSAYRNTQDGILPNKFPGGEDFNDRDEWGVRTKLSLQLSEDMSALLSYNHAQRKHNCCIGPLDTVTPGSVADREGGERGRRSDTVVDNDESAGETELDSYSLELNYQWDEYTITSISAYVEEYVFGAARADLYTRTALPQNDSYADYQQFTQEIRLASGVDRDVSFVAGVYYFDKEIDRDFDRRIDLYGIDFAPVPNFGAISVLNDFYTTSESIAAYGQLTWHVADAARLLLGARYNDDRLTIDQVVDFMPGTIPEAPPGSIKDETSVQKWSWRIIGELDIAEEAMLYASVARGYKGPGANSLPSGPSSNDGIFVDPEIPTSYEIGIKSQWLDNRLRFNGAIYYTKFEDFQASAQVPDAFPPIFFLANAGELETQGVEVEIQARLIENLDLQASLVYTDAIFSDWKDAPCYAAQSAAQGCVDNVQDLTGADMPDSPDWAFNLAATYHIPFESLPFDGFVRGNYFWQDDVQYDTTNNPLHIGESYGTLDWYTGIVDDAGRYRLQVFVRNVFDQFHINSLSGQQVVGIEAGHGLPYDYKRRIGMSLTMDF